MTAAGRRCTGEPISWLRLERYHLGEIRGDERASLQQHLATCPACAACLERIEQDEAVALPPLPAVSVTKPAGVVVRPRWPVQAVAIVGTLAAAAAVVLAIRRAHPVDGEHPTLPGVRVKGDAIAFSLVRDDGERIEGTAGTYRKRDRFKAIVTCPPGAGGEFDLVVYDASGTAFPLEAGGLACGNEVPMPGAFRLTGLGDETVCLVWNASGTVDRGKLASRASTPDALDGTDGITLCKRLTAVVEP